MGILLDASTTFKSFMELVGVLLIFIFVLVLTYFTTRWMGNYQKNRSNNRNLQNVETIRVGNNKLISIVKAGKRYYVVSVGKEEVNLIGEITEDDLTDKSFLEEGTGKDAKGSEFFHVFMENMKSQAKQKLGKK